ncbi:Rho guanine nucleotide exchange factor [Marasmius sp. AFHP31]|nr:Rho guanine nucleotide exchange factor [Marasmius sp. AFHP31]
MDPNVQFKQNNLTTFSAFPHEDNKQRSAIPRQISEGSHLVSPELPSPYRAPQSIPPSRAPLDIRTAGELDAVDGFLANLQSSVTSHTSSTIEREDDHDDTSSESDFILPTPSYELTPAHHYYQYPAADAPLLESQVSDLPQDLAHVFRPAYDHAQYNGMAKKGRFNPSYDPKSLNSPSRPYQHRFNPRPISLDIRTPEELAAVNQFLVALARRDVSLGNVKSPNHWAAPRNPTSAAATGLKRPYDRVEYNAEDPSSDMKKRRPNPPHDPVMAHRLDTISNPYQPPQFHLRPPLPLDKVDVRSGPCHTPAATQEGTNSTSLSYYFHLRSPQGDPKGGDGAREAVAQSRRRERDEGGEAGGASVNEDSMLRVWKFFKDEQKCRRVIQLKGDKAQRWLDLLQALMDNSGYPRPTRSNIFKVMLHLSKNSGMYPECLTIKNVEKLGEHPVAGGGFGDVWKGRVAEQTVCLKIVRVFNASDLQRLVKAVGLTGLLEYMQEAIVWQQLRHPNLLPFVGMYYLGESQGQLCLVSPWMDRGNLVMYLKDTPKEHVDHYSLASDIASGLAYLHDRKIVHGDMKGANVLITPELRACIADFGLSHVADSHALKLTTSVTSQSRGTTRWLAPELLIPKPSSVSTRQSDIYAYGCVCYEIFAGRVPFHDLIDGAVLLAVYVEKQQPSRPAELDDNDGVWELMTSCWNYDPSNRPTATDLLNRVRLLQSSSIPGGEGNNIQSAPSWKSPDVDRIRSNVVYPTLDLDLLDSI